MFSINAASTASLISDSISLPNFIKIKIDKSGRYKKILNYLKNHPQVAYAQPNYLRHIDFQPNDPDYPKQWALERCAIDRAWEITTGSKDIILAIIDTGIDYEHEDLRENLWINPGEDLNGNGVVDMSDFNGLDDDENGFIDDLRGWDFTDAPAWPDGGDYAGRDNDPADEHGHGTAIAGIIGAVANNALGICGVAPGCQMMNLRAGTSQGLLEEDDVASAIVYAVSNGASVINMSFGDRVASPFLRDVMTFAYNRNCVLVASAGNSSAFAAHYPSGFPETISVGATNSDDILAGYSNYGTSVDLVAPGVDIWSTQMKNKYASFGGTSASAPFVTGICGLILSQQPELTPEAVKARLLAGADDLGDPGWDIYYASGRANALKSLKLEQHPIAQILSPRMNQGFSGQSIKIVGTAAGALLDYYELAYGVGEKPESYTSICVRRNTQIVGDSLGIWDVAALADTIYTLRLSIYNKNFTSLEDKIQCIIDHTSPVISEVSIYIMVDGANHSALIEFSTDDFCEVLLCFRRENSTGDFISRRLHYETRRHRFNFTQSLATGKLEFYIEATNRAGLAAFDDANGQLYRIDLGQPPIGSSEFVSIAPTLPPGYLLNKAGDLNNDGCPELMLSEYDSKNSFGPLKVYQFRNDRFSEVFASNGVALPKDWGDSDGDGLNEILANVGPVSFTWESPEPTAFPNQIVWADSNDFWASRFADLDQDGKKESIARIGEVFSIFESVGDNQYTFIASLPNPSAGSNVTGVPHSEIGDFDVDGNREILLGDYDGDIYIYESTGDNSFQFKWSDRLPLMDTIDFLSTGDYDGDGLPEFAAGCHSDPGLDHEHEYDSRHWLIRIYKFNGNDDYVPVWEQRFFGFFPPKDFDSGISSGDVDNDGRDELLLLLFPNCHIVDYDLQSDEYRVSWYHSPCRSNAAVVCDIDGDQQNEFFFNTGSEISGFRGLSTHSGPATPPGLKAQLLDTNRVALSWFEIVNSHWYRLYRGIHPDSLFLMSEIFFTHFTDTTLQKDQHYYYAVTAVDTTLLQIESSKSSIVRIHPTDKPYVASAQYIPSRQVLLCFSEPMNASVKNSFNYWLDPDIGYPASVVSYKAGQEVLITLRENFQNNMNITITAANVFDSENMVIDTTRNKLTVPVKLQPGSPYLVRASLSSARTVTLTFNEALDISTAAELENYSIQPDVKIIAAVPGETDHRLVRLTLAAQTPIGAYGKNYIIRVANVANLSGEKIKPGRGDTASLVFYKSNLAQVNVFPNPYIISRESRGITFINLTSKAVIKILTISGRLVNTIEETDGNGGVTWDLKNAQGEQISSGIYIYYVEGSGDSKMGKFAVIR